jgi:alpha-D-ribose 1-methylphosphonate 5-triphosphate synthase subunit PhnG
MTVPESGEWISTLVVGEMPAEAVEKLLSLAQNELIEIVRPPQTGMTLMTVLDAFDAPFHLGEVLTTEAEVALGDRRGYGMVLGDAPERALARACADVLLQGKSDLLRTRVRQLLAVEEERLQARRREEEALVARTRVSFDLMPGT